jgi:hypothetical protein
MGDAGVDFTRKSAKFFVSYKFSCGILAKLGIAV